MTNAKHESLENVIQKNCLFLYYVRSLVSCVWYIGCVTLMKMTLKLLLSSHFDIWRNEKIRVLLPHIANKMEENVCFWL